MKSNLITLYYWVYQTVGHTKIVLKKGGGKVTSKITQKNKTREENMRMWLLCNRPNKTQSSVQYRYHLESYLAWPH